MYYVYVLCSYKDERFYTGFTPDLQIRLKKHKRGKVTSTKGRQPLYLTYYEACLNETDAVRREKYLKSGIGKRWLKYRLKFWIKEKNEKGLGP